ncbi:MAG: hypothetical protein ACK41W_01510 [Cyanobacteriota bacterium]
MVVAHRQHPTSWRGSTRPSALPSSLRRRGPTPRQNGPLSVRAMPRHLNNRDPSADPSAHHHLR